MSLLQGLIRIQIKKIQGDSSCVVNKSFPGGIRRTIHDESLITVIQIAITITQGGDSSVKQTYQQATIHSPKLRKH